MTEHNTLRFPENINMDMHMGEVLYHAAGWIYGYENLEPLHVWIEKTDYTNKIIEGKNA